MDKTVLKISLAGLMHDIGKFAQLGMDISKEYQVNNADLYQPFRDGFHTHQHALYTAAFIEQQADSLPGELNSGDWGEGDSFINLAAGHHRPGSPMQSIVTLADRISSGLDRAAFDKGENIPISAYRKTRLLTLFEQIDLENNTPLESRDQFSREYPLRALSAESVFPVLKNGDKTSQEAESEYRKLFAQFLDWLKCLKNKDNSIELWCQHFDSLLYSFTAQMPAARVGDVVPDVSLYDHSKSTAALSAALYLYHRDTGTLTDEGIGQSTEEKFILISGDFYGIQDFIFSGSGESDSFRSKLLRGRSFTVSLLSELAADMVCRAVGLSPLSVVLNAAGKFTILAPNTPAAWEAIDTVQDEINQWLFSISYGQSSLGLTGTRASQSDFYSGSFGGLWARHKVDMEQTKSCRLDLDRFGGVVSGYLDSFDNSLQPPLCPFCGVRPAQAETRGDSYLNEDAVSCKVCRDHILLGTMLVKNNLVVVRLGKMEEKRHNRLLEPLLGKYQLSFKPEQEFERAAVDNIVRVWKTTVSEDGTAVSTVTGRFINGHVPVYDKSDLCDDRLVDRSHNEDDLQNVQEGVEDGRPKTFSDMAQLALNVLPDGSICGTSALGVLKADVDSLGLLMGCGLPEKRYTISRIATLSRQLDSFFSIYLPHLLKNDERFTNVYTVFAGGDDLFLIGPWSRMVELALFLRDKFSDFVCKNKQLHFSAGIVMGKAHTPVETLAERSEHALEKAKDEGKNRVTVFNETVSWEQLAALFECTGVMADWRQRLLSASVFYRLNEIVDMADSEKKLDGKDIHISDMQCLRWRAQLKYQIARNLNPELKGEARDAGFTELESFGQWLQKHRGAMRIPLWTILYNHR